MRKIPMNETDLEKFKKFQRYRELKRKLNPLNDKFIIMEDTPEWKEFNQLTTELFHFIKAGLL